MAAGLGSHPRAEEADGKPVSFGTQPGAASAPEVQTQGSLCPSAHVVQKESIPNQSFWDKVESVLVTGWCAFCLLPVVVGVEAAQTGWWLSRWREAGLCAGAEVCPGLSSSPLAKEELAEPQIWSGREMWVVGTRTLLGEGLIQGQGRKAESRRHGDLCPTLHCRSRGPGPRDECRFHLPSLRQAERRGGVKKKQTGKRTNCRKPLLWAWKEPGADGLAPLPAS